MKNHKLLFLITLLYFALGFVNIHFALLGLICMALPFVLLFKDKKKTFCQGYCPRASLYSTVGKTTNKRSLKTPQYFIKGDMKWIMLIYFAVSLTFISITTYRVGVGASLPMNHLRFLIFFPLNWKMPQLFYINGIATWVTHLSFRFYSMMMTTTVIGLVLALVYKPRTWCTICPISTVSDVYLKSVKKQGKV